MQFKSSRNVVQSCTCNVIGCPTYRSRILLPHQLVKHDIRRVCHPLQSELLEMEVMPDRVHLQVGCDAQFRTHRPGPCDPGQHVSLCTFGISRIGTGLRSLWTNSYFVATVGGAPLAVIKESIENQKDR